LCSQGGIRWKDNLPQDKIEQYDTLVRNRLDVSSKTCEDLSDQQLQEAAPVDFPSANPTDSAAGPEWVLCYLGSDKEALSILCSQEFYHKDGALTRPSRVM